MRFEASCWACLVALIFLIGRPAGAVSVDLLPGAKFTEDPYILAPEESVTVTVQIKDDSQWTLLSSHAPPPTSDKEDYLIWKGGGSGRSYSYTACNTHWLQAETKVTVNATWVPIPKEGEGGGGDTTTIDGWVELIAKSQEGEYHIEAETNLICAGSHVILRAYMTWETLEKAATSIWSVVEGPGQILGSSTGTTVTVQGTNGGTITVQGALVADPSKQDSVEITVLKVEIKIPSGDPTKSMYDQDGANGWNERTYNEQYPGVVTVVCEAEYTPCADMLRWTIEDVGEIQATWEPHIDGNSRTGKGLNPTATFSGLPAQYTGFGSRTISLTMDEPGITSIDTQEAEIFFPRGAANHPGSDPWEIGPNWYYYSLQILPCVADAWYYANTNAQASWMPNETYTLGGVRFTDFGCPGNPFYYIAHENKHHTDFFQDIWEGPGYEDTEDTDKDGIRDDFERDQYGSLENTFNYIIQEDWSEARATATGNAASGDTSYCNQYWCDPGTLKGYQP